LKRRLASAISFAKECGEICRDDAARALWIREYARLSEGVPGLLGAMTARAEAQVMRLATIYALLDCSGIIGENHLRAALAAWKYAENSARFIFGSALGDPLADEILRALRGAPQGLDRTDIRDHFGRHKSAVQIDRALAVLREGGMADAVIEQTGGRPSERWFAVTSGATKATEAIKVVPDTPLSSHMSLLSQDGSESASGDYEAREREAIQETGRPRHDDGSVCQPGCPLHPPEEAA
jgi:hypothetical protein